MIVITVEMAAEPAATDAVALIVPLGIDTEMHRFQAFEPPPDCELTLVAEERTRQMAAVIVPPRSQAPIRLRQVFSQPGLTLDEAAYRPEASPLTVAAPELAAEARDIAERAGFGLAGLAAIVSDTNDRFDYGEVPVTERWYYGTDAVPIVACTAGNCIDINTYLVAALRAAGYEAAYITCYFFPDVPEPSRKVIPGMHCWVRTRCQGVVQDWDIAHFKKAGRSDVSPMLNPIPGQRVALAYGRDHRYFWRDVQIRLSTPSRPLWVMANGETVWGSPPKLMMSCGLNRPANLVRERTSEHT